VTWNVGPHAKPEPYGPHHKIAFVSLDQLLSGAHHPHSTPEMNRHANDIGQQMNQGDVINVPHVKFEGGRPVIGPEHHGALIAAGQRGASKVPVVVHRDHQLSLGLHVGGLEPQRPGKPGQDKSVNWRWNGKGWYTKPSFNNGRCPAGNNADSNKDQCIGGGPAPGSAVSPEQKSAPAPAEFWGAESRPSWMAPPPGGERDAPAARRRRRRIVRPSPSAGPANPPLGPVEPEDLPEPLDKQLDRSQIPGAPVKLPPGYGLARDTLKYRVDDAIGAYELDHDGAKLLNTARSGLRKRTVTIDPDPADTPENTQTKQMIIAARDEMMQRYPPGSPTPFMPGKFLGAGAGGAVFAGPKDPDGVDTVYKFDAGPYEARLADATMAAGLSGKNGLGILPRYISTHRTGQKFSPAGLPLHVIHREDLDDIKIGLNVRDRGVLGGRRGSTLARMMGHLQRNSIPQNPPPGVDPADIGAEATPLGVDEFSRLAKIKGPGAKQFGGNPVPWSAKAGEGWDRKRILQEFDQMVPAIRARAMRGGPVLRAQWPRIEAESRKLLEHGIVPCDLHEDNWGIRKGSGEISMRDAGCASVVAH